MPTQQDVTQARTTAQQAATQAADLAGGAYNVESVLQKRLDEAYDSSQDIVGPLDEATATYLSSPQVGREKFQDIFNPFSREKLVSQYVGQESLPMLSLANILGSRKGSIADTIKAGTGAYQAQATTAQGQADLQRQMYQDLLGEFQFGEEQATARAKAASTGGGSGDLLKYFNAFKLNQGEQGVLTNWSTAQNSIARIKSSFGTDVFRAAVKPGPLGIYARLTNPDARGLKADLDNLQDLLSRSRSGAALNENEIKLYTQFVQGDPLSALAGYEEGPKRALEILQTIADKNTQFYGQREQATQEIFQTITGEAGIGTSTGGEVSVREISTGRVGWIPPNEFDPNLYERL